MEKSKLREDAPYTMPFEELRKYVHDFKVETRNMNTQVAFIDTDDRIGVFRRSDFIINYDQESGRPIAITERVHRSNYSIFEWWRLIWQLLMKSRWIRQEYGYDIAISIRFNFFDYTHYRGDIFEPAK